MQIYVILIACAVLLLCLFFKVPVFCLSQCLPAHWFISF